MDRKEKVLRFLKEQAKVPYLSSEIAVLLGAEKDELEKILSELVAEGQIIKTKRARYEAAEKQGAFLGVYRHNPRGFGFVSTDSGEDLFISPQNSLDALNGDTVWVREKKNVRHSREGEIINVIKRANETVTGVYRKGIITPSDDALDIALKATNANRTFEECRVAVKITDYKKHLCEVILSLGSVHEADSAVQAVLFEYGIKHDFPQEVMEEAERMARHGLEISAGRSDFRSLLTVTIDGADARDLDDAVSVHKDSDGNYTLYVHIADVSHYVTAHSALDTEALSRGTSCYYPDMVCPMLPTAISNGICSLNPNEDRLALTTKMKIDSDGTVLEYEISESVIKSDFRMTYDEVTDLLENEKSEFSEKYKSVLDMIFDMRALAEILRKRRFEKGSIDFNIPEPRIIIENGRVRDIAIEENSISHKIIEEFMLACNKTVAEHAFWAQIPFVYRVHEAPKDDKMDYFRNFIGLFGHRIGGKATGQRLMKLLEEVKGTPQYKAINTVLLRSMAKARYDGENIGHFGIGATYYCHFTSPIRRYPDLICHRIIKASLHGEDVTGFENFVFDAAEQSSERETAAEQSERDVEKIKICEYMKEKIGFEYEATVSSVTSFGFFAELDNTVEGLVRAENIQDDYYIYDEKTLTLTGERTKRQFGIGDRVKILVASVDGENGYIDFFLKEEKSNGRKGNKDNHNK